MPILWCGGEDIDFPAGVSMSFDSSAGRFRSGYARGSQLIPVTLNTAGLSLPFAGGAVTSCWVSCRLALLSNGEVSTSYFGLGRSGTSGWLVIGTSAASPSRLALQTHLGTTLTQLAAETGNSLPTSGLLKIDIQVVNYGATALVNVYVDGVLLIEFSGDTRVTGVTDLDEVVIPSAGFSSSRPQVSEVIVADEDTRALPGLVSLALTGDGTTTDWTGDYSTINQTTISDTTPNYTDTTALDQQFNWTNLPSGSFVIKAVKIAARMAKSATPSVTQVKIGYNHGGTPGFGTGATKAVTTAYETYEQLDSLNPVTSADWAQADMNALQVDLQSLT